MKILNALDLKKGAKAKHNRLWAVSQPLQFLPIKEKDAQWTSWNLDWLEWNGIKQLRKNARRLMKNYKLAQGIIDKTDYVAEEENEMKDVVDNLASNDEMDALELKFYPIIPNVINTLVTEFAKRNKRITFRAVDEFTYNEILERKRSEIEDVLVKYAEAKMVSQMIEMGMSLDDPEVQEKFKQQTSPEALKRLPEIEDFYRKDYEVLAEKWAAKQYAVDEERFRMDELEERAFRDKLITDREFWHFHMMDDDYDIEVWNPAVTFYHKSPEARYISQGSYVGKVEMMSLPDVIDKYGWVMNETQLTSLQQYYPIGAAGYPIAGYQNDGTFYDATKSHEWNVGSPSLQYRQLTSMRDNFLHNGGDIVEWVLGESEDYLSNGAPNMLRVTTAYWKSQRKLGHLTKIDEAGKVLTEIIGEEYQVTEKPVYNTSLIANKTKQNLVFGEHIEWVWINHVYGGVKIGPNAPTFLGVENSGGINPIYIGINQNNIKPLKFQFKGDNTLYGAKLPVEGRVFSDRNTRSTSLVDSMKPFQIGYNIVNNQISDILIDEIGTVIMLDQNTLPKHSLGEDWGKGNLAKAYVAMKDFSMLPLDTSITNTENALNFQHFQQLDLSQTNRLMSRIQLAQFFKQQAYEVVGVSPQRMGQQIGQTNTATGMEQAVSGSYVQTEMHFVEHSDHLMPRVHEMRTNLAQWYHSTKPSVRLQHVTSLDERVNFEINGKDIMLRDFNVYCTTKANHREILEKMKALAANNNTMGASIYDLGQVMQADSMAGLTSTLKKVEDKANQKAQEERAHQEKMQQAQAQQAQQEKAMELDHETKEAEKDRRKDLLVAEIRASGYGAMQDINENKQSDFVDNLEKLKKTEQYDETINLQRDKASDNKEIAREKMNLKKEEMNLQRELKATDLEIARENKNKYDVSSKKTKEKDKKKKS
tara:strand:- start:7364 stop:10150 length:2787 start_codon:yes stop_codon:yes gene_type:complete